MGAVKVTGGVGDLRYGLLAAMEDDIRWRGRDANDLAVDIEGAGRDFAVARLVYEDVGASRKALGYMGTFVAVSMTQWFIVLMLTTAKFRFSHQSGPATDKQRPRQRAGLWRHD